jgi:hypothetical protein
MIQFLVGGIYTLIIISLSGFIGYLIGSKELKKIIEAKVEALKKQQISSGPVKQRTPQQLKDENNDALKRIKELGL